jgi:GNAT superfamily N-acetyltransferase
MPALTTSPLVPHIRHASRKLVRELGFLHPTIAGTQFSAAAVHALVEIGDHGIHNAEDLRRLLTMNETAFEKAIDELILSGEIYEEGSDSASSSGRAFYLTVKGETTLDAVNFCAIDQVQRALEAAPPEAGDKIALALRSYAEALEICRVGQQKLSRKEKPTVRIAAGYRPGLLGRILEMHTFYCTEHAYGRSFETEIAAGFSDIIARIDNPMNQVWAAIQTLPSGEERIVGSIIIDGEDLGQQGLAHLRAFIVDKSFRGGGAGRKLLAAAMGFVDQQGFEEVKLWTMRGLDTAIHLYTEAGFVMQSEEILSQWERICPVRMYLWKREAEVVAV